MAIAQTYVPIAYVQTTGAVTAVTFNSIPTTYTHLKLIVNPFPAGSGNPYPRFNNDGTSNYYQRGMAATNTSISGTKVTSSNAPLIDDFGGFTTSTTIVQPWEMTFFNYSASSGLRKVTQYRWQIASNGLYNVHGNISYDSTGQITRIDILDSGGGNVVNTNSTISLYGILGA